MNNRQAKVLALRLITGVVSNIDGCNIEGGPDLSDEDEEKVLIEVKKIGEVFYKKAVKMGGDFNQFTGVPSKLPIESALYHKLIKQSEKEVVCTSCGNKFSPSDMEHGHCPDCKKMFKELDEDEEEEIL